VPDRPRVRQLFEEEEVVLAVHHPGRPKRVGLGSCRHHQMVEPVFEARAREDVIARDRLFSQIQIPRFGLEVVNSFDGTDRLLNASKFKGPDGRGGSGFGFGVWVLGLRVEG